MDTPLMEDSQTMYRTQILAIQSLSLLQNVGADHLTGMTRTYYDTIHAPMHQDPFCPPE